MTKSNFISMIAVFLFFGYAIFIITNRKSLEENILSDGYYCPTVIIKIEPSKFSSKTIIYRYNLNKINYENNDLVNYKFSEKYKTGDTIIIKFLPNEPGKSMIMEDKEYKSCYGVPPAEGWKELPKCE